MDNLREFGVKLSVIAAPLREVSWLRSAVSASGIDGMHVAQTLRFSRFIAGPRPPLAFKAFLVQNRALLRVWRQVFSRPRFLSSGLGLARLELKSLRFCNVSCVHFSKTAVNVDSKSKLGAPSGTFELLAAVL